MGEVLQLNINCKTGEETFIEVEDIKIDLEFLAMNVRMERNELLSKTDWTQLTDCPLSEMQKVQYRVYRQALRDITEQEGFPMRVLYPVI